MHQQRSAAAAAAAAAAPMLDYACISYRLSETQLIELGNILPRAVA